MLDSSMLGNDNNPIDVSLPEPPKPKPVRSASSLLGNDNNQIDIELPKEQPLKTESNRERIARARAKRREEAGKRREERRNTKFSLPVQQPQQPEQPEEPAHPISESDLLERVRAAEEAHFYEKQRIARRDAALKVAAKEYRTATLAAKHTCKKLRRHSDHAWRREAEAFHAKNVLPRTERIIGGVNIAVSLSLVAAIAVGMLVLERPTVSDIENRNLATMPEFSPEAYFSGEYTAGVAAYYDDTVPMRSLFKNMTAAIRRNMGWNDDDTLIFHGDASIFQESQPAQTTAAPPDSETETTTTTTAVTTADPAVSVTTTNSSETEPADSTTAAAPTEEPMDEGGELSNNILIYQKRAISLYGGSFSVGENYASYLNRYKSELGKDVNIYSMVIPTPCSFYTPEEYRKRIGSERDNINHINEHLVDVIPVDAYGALEAHSDEYIYMRTDHHWSALGAFYAAEEFSAAARVPFAPISEYERVSREGYVGTMYGYSGAITLKKNPEEFFFYQPKAQYTTTYYNTSARNGHSGNLLMNIDRLGSPVNWYLVYLGGDERVTHIETEVKNGRTLAVFKDSYGNALIPWLTSSFEHIYVIDIRYFKRNAVQYLREVGATDVLFAMNTFSATGGNCKQIDRIRRQ